MLTFSDALQGLSLRTKEQDRAVGLGAQDENRSYSVPPKDIPYSTTRSLGRKEYCCVLGYTHLE